MMPSDKLLSSCPRLKPDLRSEGSSRGGYLFEGLKSKMVLEGVLLVTCSCERQKGVYCMPQQRYDMSACSRRGV